MADLKEYGIKCGFKDLSTKTLIEISRKQTNFFIEIFEKNLVLGDEQIFCIRWLSK
jgi:hypothetical protein